MASKYMQVNPASRVCLVPRVFGVGGMVSFRRKFSIGLEKKGIYVANDMRDFPFRAVLVIGGTRDLIGLWQAKRRGVPIVQRLNGMNWLHRQIRTGLRHYLRAEYGNMLLNLIRTRIADRIVYQSQFAKNWWERVYGSTSSSTHVIYNGVDLSIYHPNGPHERPVERYRLLLVEGNLAGGYELGLRTSIQIVERLNKYHNIRAELMVVGKVSPEVRDRLKEKTSVPIHWVGLVPPERIPRIDRSAHLFYSGDLNAACPNAVIESLACGLPVIAFDTGALPELVTPETGRIVPYGSNPWVLDPPDIPALAHAASEILPDIDMFRLEARARAEEMFDLDDMVEGYLTVLEL